MDKPVALPTRKKWVSPLGAAMVDIEADGWNACLDEIAKLGPLYTHADPGEVERLRAALADMTAYRDNGANEILRLHDKLAELREVIKHSDSNIQRQSLRISNQRAQLTEALNKRLAAEHELLGAKETLDEAHALLRKISGYNWANVDPEERARTRAELRDMLSASAEPSAPAEIDEQTAFEEAGASIGISPRYLTGREWRLWQARAALERKP